MSTYARGLEQAITRLTAHPLVLRASHGDDGAVHRTLGALRDRERRIVRTERELIGRDLFRRAHIHFSLTRRPLRLVVPGKVGIMHWTYPVPMLMEGWANLYTVHDAIPLVAPELSPIDPQRHRRVLAALAEEAVRFITVSEAARRNIIAAVGPSPVCAVAGQAVNTAPPPPAALPAGLRPGGYFLFCGAVEPRKNLERLVAAHGRADTVLPLVVVGPDGWRAGPINAAIAAAPGALRLEYQDGEGLMRLIQAARALLFPSLAEGFGLPVVEAMALGTPVLTSAGGALEEVAGGAALLVDPTDIEAMAAAISRLAGAEPLREALIAAGLRRAADFTLDRFVARLAAIYREVAPIPT